MSESFNTCWRSFIPLQRSIQPINMLISAGQQSCCDRIHSKPGICSWFPPSTALHTYPSTDSTGTAHCEQRNHSRDPRGKHPRSAMGSSSSAGSAVTEVAAWGVPRRTGGGTHREMLQVQLEHATLQGRCRFFHSHSPCPLQAAVELKHPCKKQMTARACSCVSVQQCWCSQVTMAPGTAVGPLAALLTPAPAASARDTRCWEKWLHLSLQLCASASEVRR